MADNIAIRDATGTSRTVASDEVTMDGALAEVQRVKVVHGVAGAGVDASGSNPFPIQAASVSKGYQQLTSTAAAATVASLCSGGALPTGATKVLLVPTAAVRFRDDGTNPSGTVGFPVAASQSWKYDGDLLSALKVYGAATIDAWFYA